MPYKYWHIFNRAVRDIKGNVISNQLPSCNFRIYWDGDLQDELFGDWREEIILWDASDAAHLNIFTTNIPTPYAVPTLMHDNIYRLSICWQNTAYNQPPHLGYYLPDTQK